MRQQAGSIGKLFLVLGVCATAVNAWAQGGAPSAVRVDAVRLDETAERRMVTGDVYAVQRSEVASREPGAVVEFLVDEGAMVLRGDVIARLDDANLQISLRSLQAEEKVAEAVRDQRKAEYDQAVRDEKLVRESFERGAANPKELLDAETDVLAMRAQLTQAEQQILVLQARAELLNKRISDMQITAPFDGIVVRTNSEQGQWIDEGETVVELISSGAVEAWMNVPQRFLSTVRQKVGSASSSAVMIEAGGTSHASRVDRVVPDVSPDSRTFRIITRLDNADGSLAPGMSIVGWLATGEQSMKLTVHKDAVMRNDAGAFVYVVRPGRDGQSSVAMPLQVDVLYPMGERYVVEADNLDQGEEVIIEGNERLFPYSPVQPVHGQPEQGRNSSE